MNLYKVAVNTPFNGSVLTYESSQNFTAGSHVEVPLGKRKVSGWVLEQTTEQVEKVKEISCELDKTLDLSSHELDLFQWMANYYHYPLGQHIADVLPKVMKKPRASDRAVNPNPLELEALTADQESVYRQISAEVGQGFSRQLIHGVTGSGKTHIYLRLMNELVAQGKSVLFLLPEINLTPQFLEKFRAHLNCPIDTYSSEVTPSDKYTLRQEFKLHDRARVVVAVRSGVFLPIKNLGMIIVDEEHDSSFKQDDRCAYSARDVAIKRASLLNIPVVLGSATPSMESYIAGINSKKYYSLKNRVHKTRMPSIRMIDQRSSSVSEGNDEANWPLAQETIEAIYQAKARGEQALVFINRLGFSNYIQCSSCGHQFQCPNCSTNLRYFKARAELACQTCGLKAPMPKICPECSCITLSQKGYGTEKVEEVLTKVIPGLRVSRFDRDEIKNMDQLRESLDRFHNHEVDVLVGTQMLSKGHNFKRVNTVVVLGIDQQLNFPDFRAMERAWQTLVQVSGRSGRFGNESEVLIQTHSPEHPLFTHVVNHHFDEFYQAEMELRERAQCPPIAKMAAIYLTHKDKGQLVRMSQELGDWAHGLKELHFPQVDILGPRPALMEKRVNKFTWCLMLRSGELNPLHQVINAIQKRMQPVSGLQLKVDVDPQVIL